jgi:hypothetical protein
MATTDPNGPADTQMMGIVHEALRRDLRRTRAVLASEARPPSAQRVAVADHLGWMMAFLHGHHRGEDEGIYPAVRARNPAAAALLDRMDADHRAIGPAIAGVEAAALDYRASGEDDEVHRMLVALDDLESVLLPHLRQEEDEAMPVVSATLTEAELRALEEEHFLGDRSFTELGDEGHWLLDDLAPDLREVVTGTVPPVPRFVLLHGFARRYRRRSAARWSPPSPPSRAVQPQARVQVSVDVPPDAVWDVVRDVTRTGEWSNECHVVTWLGGATEAVPGARFRGRNRAGIFRWGRECEVLTCDGWELRWRTVPTALYPDSSVWTIRLAETDGGGTRIEQSYEGRGPKVLMLVYGLLIPSHRDRSEELVDDLRRLAAVAAGRRVGGRVASA